LLAGTFSTHIRTTSTKSQENYRLFSSKLYLADSHVLRKMRKIFFDFFVNPWHTGVHKEKILNQLFETCMVPARPGWVWGKQRRTIPVRKK
jgi:hypothetical protein